MMTKTIEEKDYLGNKICKGQKEDKSCPKFDVNSGKECPDDWNGDPGMDWKTNMKWECEEVIETETVNVMSGGQDETRELLEVHDLGLQPRYLFRLCQQEVLL